jgi:hypothetical protein
VNAFGAAVLAGISNVCIAEAKFQRVTGLCIDSKQKERRSTGETSDRKQAGLLLRVGVPTGEGERVNP